MAFATCAKLQRFLDIIMYMMYHASSIAVGRSASHWQLKVVCLSTSLSTSPLPLQFHPFNSTHSKHGAVDLELAQASDEIGHGVWCD